MQLFKRIRSFFPSSLPVGMSEFETWSDSIIELTGPIADPRSIKFVLSDLLLRVGPNKNSTYSTIPSALPKNHFVQGLRNSASKQVAGQVFQDIKNAQIAEAKAAAEAANPPPAEDTAKIDVVSNVPQ